MPTKSSNYKRIHHWHERISQLLLMESRIPDAEMLQIGSRLLSGEYAVINKDTIRAVLRSLKMQPYIEKYLQIIHRVTGIAPPVPGQALCRQLDALFMDLQTPFDSAKVEKRKNFLNYNYVFCRIFQKLKCHQFCMFFPLIKSKPKLKALNETWARMCNMIDWPVTTLESVPQFSVHLEQPALLLSRLATRSFERAPAVIAADPWLSGYPRWGRPVQGKALLRLAPPRSYPPEPESPEPQSTSKRQRTLSATGPQWMSQ